MLSLTAPEPPDDAPNAGGMGILPACLLLAALAQILFLLHWPMYLYGRWVPFLPAVAVALVRMGIYSGLAWGLFFRSPTAWAGGLSELARSVLLFLISVWQHDGVLSSELFPAWWAQGMFSAALPVLLVMLSALDWGWRPGSDLVTYISVAARLIVAVTVLAAVSLRRKAPMFQIAASCEAGTLLRLGLPVALMLTAVEAAAWFLAGVR